MVFLFGYGHDIYFLVGKHSMEISATRPWGFDHQKETWEALPPMLSRRVGAAANTSASLASLFPPSTTWRGFSSWGSCCGRMFLCLWWLGWTSVSASSFTPGTWKSQTESGLFWKWQTSAGFFKPSQQANLMFLVSGSCSFKVFSQHRFLPNSAYCVQRRLNSAERFNPMTGAWEALPPMQERRFLGLLIPCINNQILGCVVPVDGMILVGGSKIRRSPRGRYKTL